MKKSPRELPHIPTRLILSAASFAKVASIIASPRAPTADMRKLMGT